MQVFPPSNGMAALPHRIAVLMHDSDSLLARGKQHSAVCISAAQRVATSSGSGAAGNCRQTQAQASTGTLCYRPPGGCLLTS